LSQFLLRFLNPAGFNSLNQVFKYLNPAGLINLVSSSSESLSGVANSCRMRSEVVVTFRVKSGGESDKSIFYQLVVVVSQVDGRLGHLMHMHNAFLSY
jgi:hypothetical protein